MSNFEIISSDSEGIRAILAAAEKIRELLDERNVTLGILEGVALGEDQAVAVVVAKGAAGVPGALLVTVEERPRLVRAKTLPEPVPKQAHVDVPGQPHFFGGDCICTDDCCNDRNHDCTCIECGDEDHGH